MTEYETFMVYELDNSGEKKKLGITEEELQANLHPDQVLVIIREDLRRIFIWKGPKSPVRKRFISSRVAQELQEELRADSRYHRCKIVSVDAGDEPIEFLQAFQLESMEVTETLADMRYVRNIERDKGMVTKSNIIARDQKEGKEKYFSPALQDTRNEVVMSSFPAGISKPIAKAPVQQPSITRSLLSLSKGEQDRIKEKILKTEIPSNYKRLNLILGHTLLAAVSKTAKVFGEEVEETGWETVKQFPKELIELDNHILRIYSNKAKGIIEAVEILEKDGPSRSTSKGDSTSGTTASKDLNFNDMTVKDLKLYAEKNKINLPTSARKAEIIEILEKTRKVKQPNRRQLPKIPSNDDN
ncbi:MAG: hypothetical protein ACFE8N_12790 [Promethearchaeota archaeon]